MGLAALRRCCGGGAVYLLAKAAALGVAGRWDAAARLLERWRLVRRSGLFDAAFYQGFYPDVAAWPISPLGHFVAWGVAEGRRPNALFDPAWYGGRVPEAGDDPLVHYLRHGWRQGLAPGPMFDVAHYRTAHPGLAEEPLAHYLRRGWRQGAKPNRLFDPAWYLAGNPDVAAAGLEPLGHYVTRGAAEGRDAAPGLVTSAYVRLHPHLDPRLAEGTGNPLAHYLAGLRADPVTAAPVLAAPGLDDPEPAPGRGGVCLVTPELDGDMGRACRAWARRLARAGQDVTLLLSAPSSDNTWRPALRRDGIRLVTLDELPAADGVTIGHTWFLERSWRVLRHLETHRFDAVHFQDRQAAGYWPLMARRLGLALTDSTVTVTLHGPSRWLEQQRRQFPDDPVLAAKLDWCERFCLAQADMVLSPSRHLLDWAAAEGVGLAAGRRVISIPAERRVVSFPAERRVVSFPADARAVTGADPDHLVFVGGVAPRHDLELFAAALRRLKAMGAALPRRISVVGGSVTGRSFSSRDLLAGLAAELPGMELREAEAVPPEGLLVFAAVAANAPHDLLEAIADGRPFLATAVGGLPELADARVLCPPTAVALAELLARRSEIDFAALEHPYAATAWDELPAALPRPAPPPPEAPLPLVTLCVPFYNHAAYLDGLLEALRRQSYPRLEVVLVDDGSAPAAAQAFAAAAESLRGDDRFRFLRVANGGPGLARNIAVAQGRGDYLVFLDADNLPHDERFVARLVAAALASGADCITVPYQAVDHGVLQPAPGDVRYAFQPFGPCLEVGFLENTFGDVTMIVRRAVFERVGGFPTSREAWEDWQFLLRLALAGAEQLVFPEPLFYYRFNPAGRNETATIWRNLMSLMDELRTAPSADLWRIVRRIALPLMARGVSWSRGL